MKKIFICLIYILSTFPIYSKELYTNSDKVKIRTEIFEGCIRKQNISSQNIMHQNVIEEICNCYADDSTKFLLGKVDFQIAFSKKQTDTVKSIIKSDIATSTFDAISNKCLDTTVLKFGGVKNLYLDKPKENLDEKKGLLSTQRNEFIDAGMQNCIDGTRQSASVSKEWASDYCKCALNVMADNLSVADLWEVGRGSDKGKSILASMGEVSQKKCLK